MPEPDTTWNGITDDDLTEAQAQAATALLNMAIESRAGQASCVLYDLNDEPMGNVTVAKVRDDHASVVWIAFAYDCATGDVVTATAAPDNRAPSEGGNAEAIGRSDDA